MGSGGEGGSGKGSRGGDGGSGGGNSTATWERRVERRIVSVRERGLIPERVTKRARGPAIAVHALPLASGLHALPYDLVYRP